MLTYFLTTMLSDLQYSEQDMIIEYQNIVLYQIMAERWEAMQNQKNHMLNYPFLLERDEHRRPWSLHNVRVKQKFYEMNF